MVERARLESEYTGNRIGGSNPPLSAIYYFHIILSNLVYIDYSLSLLDFTHILFPEVIS